MKHIRWLLLLCTYTVSAQQFTLQQVQQMARQHYPLLQQQQLLDKSNALSIDNLSKNFLPQAAVSAQASYQSDVTHITLPFPGINLTPPGKDQYKIVTDVNQLLYDGGSTQEQQRSVKATSAIEQQKLEVELYKLKERMNQLYLGILYLDAQLQQVALIKEDLNNGIHKVAAQVENGVAFRSALNLLKAEWLKADQRRIELAGTRKSYCDMLSLFINQRIDSNTRFETPSVTIPGELTAMQRPEIKLLDAQQNYIGIQNGLINAKNKPKASLFVQGGYGRPGLNFLNNAFAFYYITGLRLNWNFGNLYTRKNEKQLLELNKQTIEAQRQTFLLNSNATFAQQLAEINRLKELINSDEAIIELRNSVKTAAKAQLDNGVITANDYLREVNAEDQARQLLITHQVQLLQANINYQSTAGL